MNFTRGSSHPHLIVKSIGACVAGGLFFAMCGPAGAQTTTQLPSATQTPATAAPATTAPAEKSPSLTPDVTTPQTPAPAAQTTPVPPSAPAQAPAVATTPVAPHQAPLSADDVSWLFPTPTKPEDLANLIAIKDLTVPDPQDPTKRVRVWSDAAFQQFLAIAASPAAMVAGTSDRIGLPPEVKTIDAWHIAGVRFDAGAPGLTDAIIKQYGQSPQIRLILQPVTKNDDGSLDVHDITAHLVFSFLAGAPDPAKSALPPAQAGCFPRPVPDMAFLQQIVGELADLRTKLSTGQLGADKITTSGKPLGVHPGLVDTTTASNVRAEMKAILERHLSSERLGAMAIMGLPADAPEPWIFLAMTFANGRYIPIPGPTLDGKQMAQKLNAVGSSPGVVPTPHTNNLAPATCLNATVPGGGVPIAKRQGVATAGLFPDPPQSAKRTSQVLSVVNVIADPAKSHFFNTDCISCHTETRRAMELLTPQNIPKINAAPLPNGSWNVRNFGWSPLVEGPQHGTVTRRTAAETAAVVDFINAKILPK